MGSQQEAGKLIFVAQQQRSGGEERMGVEGVVGVEGEKIEQSGKNAIL
jgi:hypothetical protein